MTRTGLMAHAAAQAVLWLCIAVLINHIASVWFVRVDLTQDQRYSLNPASVAMVRRLDKPLVAHVFVSNGLEAPYNNHKAAIVEKLEELRAWSGGMLTIRVSDPTGDEAIAAEAERFGIQPVQYRYRDKNRSEIKSVWLGVSFTYADRQQVVSPISHLETLEYELVRAVRAVTTSDDDRRVIAMSQGHGEPDLAKFDGDNPLARLREQLEASYQVRSVTLGGDKPIPEDVDLLLVTGPQTPVRPRAQYQIDQFLMRGGRVAFFLSGVRPDWQRFRALEVQHGLRPMLAHYGVTVDRSLILDRTSNEVMNLPVAVGNRRQMVAINYPLIPVSRELSPSSPAVKGLDHLVLPFVTPVRLVADLPAERFGSVWATSSPSSVITERFPSLAPQVVAKPIDGELPGPAPVAVAIQGPFRSFFAGKEIPPPPGRGAALPEDELVTDGQLSQLVVVGSADFIANNPAFVLNTVDWLLQDAALIDIRSRSFDAEGLTPPDRAGALKWKAFIVGVPLSLLVLLGGLALRRRRA